MLISQRHINKAGKLGRYAPVNIVVKVMEALTGNQAGDAAIDGGAFAPAGFRIVVPTESAPEEGGAADTAMA